MSSQQNLLEVESVSKVFKMYSKPIDRLKESLHPFRKKYSVDFRALEDVSFSVSRGHCFGIVGSNGAGKSTLLKIISGVLKPTTGRISIDGKVSSLLELGTGFDAELSGVENIRYIGTLMGLGKDHIESTFEDILSFADIGEFILQPVKTYSSGMFARLAFSVAINVEPDLLIVDEVLSVGDSLFRKKCAKKIQELRNAGVSILFVSHDDYLIRNLCDYALLLRGGQVVYKGNPDECMRMYRSGEIIGADVPVFSNTKISAEEHADDTLGGAGNLSGFCNIVSAEISSPAMQESGSVKFHSGQDIILRFRYEFSQSFVQDVAFVCNIYSSDETYVWGTTTIMDGLKPFQSGREGEVSVTIKSIPLLSGSYSVRFAINDDSGLVVLAEANPALSFVIEDKFEAVGLINLEHHWEVLWRD